MFGGWPRVELSPEELAVRRRGGRKGGRATARQRRAALVPQDKVVLTWRRKGLRVSEIAAETGLSERSVYRSLARSRKRGMLI